MAEISAEKVWAEYERGVSYNTELGLYDTVRQNENFFIGKQWEGVVAPDLDKPVNNIFKRVMGYFIATIASDDVSAQVRVFGGGGDETDTLLQAVSGEFDRVIEYNRIKAKNRYCIRDAAVDGDACMYVWYDPDKAEGEFSTGEIVAEEIDNTNVYFGNPQVDDPQRQPWIIISRRVMVEDARKEAEENGRDPEGINADDDPNGVNTEREHGKVTVLLRFWKENGTVWFMKTCKGGILKPPTNTKYKLYPIAWWSWDRVKNSYHGQSCITGLIPNQIFINKEFAMCMEHIKKMAFPKIVYDKSRLAYGWDNGVGQSIGVQGNPNDAFAVVVGGAELSGQVVDFIDKTSSMTRDTMGASDAALGNVKPDNTSAIIAVQKSAQMPLELQRMAFYDFVEQYIRVFLEIMRVDYKLRLVQVTGNDGKPAQVFVDFSALENLSLKLEVNVGASTYFSELAQIQTIDNLLMKGIITDPVLYLECIPDGYIKDKAKIIEKIKEEKARMLAAQTNGMLPGGETGMEPEFSPAALPEISGLAPDLAMMGGGMT